MLALVSADAIECPATPEPHVPQAPSPLNIDTVKGLLRRYHKDTYMDDIAAVFSMAQNYVERRAVEVKKPAVVLDIDETSLSNWTELDLDDLGFIKNGPCSERPGFACGFSTWVAKGAAPAIRPARDFYNAIRTKHVAVFFITGRRDSQRSVTVKNLHRAGFRGWAKLATRPDDDRNSSIVQFKSGERARIIKDGYSIIATIGDQNSDIDGGSAECGFKLPNPFYFIP
jgi:acid phosphatase